jgi:hypothetical protein
LPLADPQKNGKFRDSKSLRFFLQDFNQVHGFTPSLALPHNRTWCPGNADIRALAIVLKRAARLRSDFIRSVRGFRQTDLTLRDGGQEKEEPRRLGESFSRA